MEEHKNPDTESLSISEKLSAIQCNLKAPKSQYNKFGNYAYRKAEDVLESVKPLLKMYGLALTLEDTIVEIGGRVYIQATARLFDMNDKVEVTAFAREEESKKGMDASQVTGATSSYARKYALNGLFCIDDTADSDQTNTHGKETPAKASPTKEPAQTSSDSSIMDKAVAYVKSQRDKKKAYDMVISKYGEELTESQKNVLKKFVR